MLLNVFRHNTFATGGSDGFVNIWDGFNKKRLCQVQYVFIPCFVQPTVKMLSPLHFTVVKTSLIWTETVCEAQCNECLWRTLVPGRQSGVIYMIISFLGQGGTALRFVLFFCTVAGSWVLKLRRWDTTNLNFSPLNFQFHRYPTSISSLSFSNDGGLLAIASSYMNEEDEKE